MKIHNDKIIKILKEASKITDKDIDLVNGECQKDEKLKPRDAILRLGLIPEKEILMLVSRELSVPFLNLAKYKIEPEIGKLVPEKLARKHQIIPIAKTQQSITVAVWDPFNLVGITDVQLITKRKVDLVLATQRDVEDALNTMFPDKSQSLESIAEEIDGEDADVQIIQEEDEGGDIGDANKKGSPVVKLADLIVRQALKERTSDIHIEPMVNRVRVRYRIDGALRTFLEIPKKYQNSLLARLKIMSSLDITENRVPQDGRFKIKLPEKEVDFRVSILPVYHGGKVVMRVLDKSALSIGLDALGFFPDTLEAFKEAVAKPFGMILITGPTGSGKSTTLYSILNQLNTPERNIITVEDPIEYQVKGISQIPVRSEVGMTFASGLRAILRQSPDVVMVGEIRDGETADIAIKASLTGQIVLSTLHTNDAPGAVTRMIDMGIEPFLVASSVVLTAAQRLCRKICNYCKEPANLTIDELIKKGFSAEDFKGEKKPTLFFGKGCDKCSRTGSRGRLAVLEAMSIDDDIRDRIVKRVSSFELKEYAMSHGMTTLRQDALRKALQGSITIEEVLRATSEDE